MQEDRQVGLALGRLQRLALIAGLVALVLGVAGAFVAREAFFRSYLVAYLYWTGIAVGCLAILLLHHTAGGGWGASVLRFLEAGAGVLPLMAALFVPLLVGLPIIYAWAQPEVVAGDAILQQKQGYLNVPFFVLRTVVYFAVWIFLAYQTRRWSQARDRSGDPTLTSRLQRLSTGGLILMVLTGTFAAIDWVMSLDPHWYSSVYGLMVLMGQVLSGFAFVLLIALTLARRPSLAAVFSPARLNDLGSLLLAFVMLWAYLAFSQFLLIWYGNLAEEVPWYLERIQGGWMAAAVSLVALHFALPFLLLLFRNLKRSVRPLALVAGLLVIMRYVDTYWLVGPWEATGGSVLLDILLLAGIGGLWLALFLHHLRSLPLVSPGEPRLLKTSPREQRSATH